ncbi:Flagellar hook-length control protein FliK [Maliponia aquimaris]|uniref:Flagellar hook-length control protein FliK n=2 Tax=Maliponia aquimaris TaxID=1673631 RepID=A0A238JPS1_9RHOB|nr:Flagellar hook-length control protein FliK [Maliponia aquimaris]
MSRVTSPLLADLLEDPKVTQGLTAEGLPELRAHATGTAVHTAAPMARPDPQPVLRQIADGVARMRDGGIELQLAPEELGRVRMQMVPGESGLAVHITADRPETLDLMRRNIEQLARDLADAGYGGAAFTFGDSGGGNEDRTPRGGSGALTREPAERAIPEPAETTPVTDGLDIRI